MSNFDGFAILPRYATEIYFNCSTADENMLLYNNLYTSQLGTSTFDQARTSGLGGVRGRGRGRARPRLPCMAVDARRSPLFGSP